jgi:hypothetical protein
MAVGDKIVVGMLVIAGLAWWQQDNLKKQWQNLHQTPKPVATKTAIYTWKDKDETVHYSTMPEHKNATQIIIDTGKISRLEPLPQKQEVPKEEKLLLQEVREDMIQNRNKILKAREKHIVQEIER